MGVGRLVSLSRQECAPACAGAGGGVGGHRAALGQGVPQSLAPGSHCPSSFPSPYAQTHRNYILR